MKKIWIMMILTLLAGLTVGCSQGEQGTVTGEKNELSGTIRISSFSQKKFLEEAVQKFESHHPNVKVEIDAYLSPDMLEENNATENIENYINILNTELMSGKGADVIADVMILPYQKYIDRHVFADLNQLMEADEDFDTSQYHTNIFKAMEVNGGLYTLPIDYMYELLGSKSKIEVDDKAWNWEEFFAVAQKELEVTGEDSYILPDSDEKIFLKIFRQNYGHFVNEEEKTANFTTEEFIHLLKQCKSLGDRDLLVKSAEESSGEVGKQALFQYCEGFSYVSLALGQVDGQTNLYRWPTENKGSYDFNSSYMYALNDASPNKAVAWEFLKFFLSDEMQTSLFIGFPINKSALQERMVLAAKPFYRDESIKLSESEKTELIEKSASYHDSMVNDLKIYRYVNSQIFNMVRTEIQPFFSDKASAENVARIIQEKVRMYLNEQA